MTVPRVPEKTEQANIVKLLRSIGADVWVLGTRRPKGDYQGTRQTPGIPDLYVVLPAHETPVLVDRVALWIECKAAGGKLTSAQVHFRACCVRTPLVYIAGGLDEVIRWLVAYSYLKPESVARYRVDRGGPVLSTRAIHCLARVGVSYPCSKEAVRAVLPALQAGITSDLGNPRCVRDLGPKTLAEITAWVECETP